jgi:hypothetical protein
MGLEVISDNESQWSKSIGKRNFSGQKFIFEDERKRIQLNKSVEMRGNGEILKIENLLNESPSS